MLKVPLGTDASAIAGIVSKQYKNSSYSMPNILEDLTGGL
jgi:hypothetical protein